MHVLVGVMISATRRIETKNDQIRRRASSIPNNATGGIARDNSRADISEPQLGSKTKITRMLLSVCFVYLVCHSAAVIISWKFTKPISTNHEWARRYLLFSLANFFLILSSSVNIFLYFLTNQTMRTQLCKILRFGNCRCMRR